MATDPMCKYKLINSRICVQIFVHTHCTYICPYASLINKPPGDSNTRSYFLDWTTAKHFIEAQLSVFRSYLHLMLLQISLVLVTTSSFSALFRRQSFICCSPYTHSTRFWAWNYLHLISADNTPNYLIIKANKTKIYNKFNIVIVLIWPGWPINAPFLKCCRESSPRFCNLQARVLRCLASMML